VTRVLNASLLADLATGSAAKTELIELNFSTGIVRLCTAAQNLLEGGNTYLAVGGALEVEGLGETLDEKGQGVSMSLSGVDQTILAAILSAKVRGRKAAIYYAHFNPVTGALIGAKYKMFEGYMNEPWEINEDRGERGGGTVKIKTRLTSRLTDLSRVKGFLTNNQQYQSFFNGDTFFQNVAGIMGQQIFWGQRDPSIPHGWVAVAVARIKAKSHSGGVP
jgi:hypothetical protein